MCAFYTRRVVPNGTRVVYPEPRKVVAERAVVAATAERRLTGKKCTPARAKHHSSNGAGIGDKKKTYPRTDVDVIGNLCATKDEGERGETLSPYDEGRSE